MGYISLNEEGQTLVSKEEWLRGSKKWVESISTVDLFLIIPRSIIGREAYREIIIMPFWQRAFHSPSQCVGAKIAREHVDSVANLVSTFLQAALSFVIKDIKVRQNVQNCVEVCSRKHQARDR